MGRQARKTRNLRVVTAVVAVAGGMTLNVAHACGSTLYFDVNGAAAGSGVVAGDYTWDSPGLTWSSDPGGAVATQSWEPGGAAVFQGPADPLTAARVTVVGTQTAASIAVAGGSLRIRLGTVALAGGDISVDAGQTLTFDSKLTGTGFTKTGAGVLSLGQTANGFIGGFAVTAGVVQFAGENITTGSADSRTGASPTSVVPDYVRLNGGGLRDTSTGVAGLVLNTNKGITLGANGGTIDIADSSTTNMHQYRGVIAGDGALTKTGPGMLVLGPAPSTYAGATTIGQGAVRIAAADTLPTSTDLTIAAGATLDLAGFGQSVASLNGGGRVVTSGRLSITGPGASEWSGVVTGNEGVTVSGGFLRLSTLQQYTGATILSGAGTSFGVRLGLNNALPGGPLQFQATGPVAAPTLDLNGFNQLLNSVARLNPGVGQPSITNTAATASTLTLNAAAGFTLDVPVSGNVTVVKTGAGAVVFGAAHSYTGLTRVSQGILAIAQAPTPGGDASRIALSNATLRFDAPVTLSRPVNLEAPSVIDTGGNSATIATTISGVGPLSKVGAGTLTVSSIAVPSLSVLAGEVRVAPDSPTPRITGLRVETGRLDLTNNRAVFPDLTPGTVAPMLAAARTGVIAGDWLGSTGITSGSVAADPGRLLGIGYATAGQVGVASWGTQSDLVTTDLLVRVTYYGDVNLDGVVNGDDLARLDRSRALGGLAGTASWSDGDVNYDRVVNAADYLLADRAYLLSRPGQAATEFLADRQAAFGDGYVNSLLVSVPEPSAVLIAGVIPLLLRRRRGTAGVLLGTRALIP